MDVKSDKWYIEKKRIWDSIWGPIYHENPENRIGDEIQMTALLSFFREKGITAFYKDVCPYVSALNIFPDSLVNFVKENTDEYPKIDTFNLWIWSPFLRDRGFYTSSKKKYDETESKYDCVFCPCLSPAYNEVRGLHPENAIQIHRQLRKCWGNSIMIVDADKSKMVPMEDGVVYSKNILTTFRRIELSRFFVGCDTGTTHYAGSIGHPRMTLIYPDETEVQERIKWQHDMMAWIFKRPELVNYKASSLPCCNPSNYKVLQIEGRLGVEPSAVAREAYSNA
jgi:hypothetical protein